jgi:hypothetical protein
MQVDKVNANEQVVHTVKQGTEYKTGLLLASHTDNKELVNRSRYYVLGKKGSH